MTGNIFDAQDLAQETFLSAYQKLSDFQGVHERAWICKIATNKCLDFLKSASRRTIPATEETFDEILDWRQAPEQQYLMVESKNEVLSLCRQLSPPYNEIAEAHFYEEKSAKEIAEEKNRNVKTVQTQIYRARAMIKKKLRGGDVR